MSLQLKDYMVLCSTRFVIGGCAHKQQWNHSNGRLAVLNCVVADSICNTVFHSIRSVRFLKCSCVCTTFL